MDQAAKKNYTKITQAENARRQFDLVWAECDDAAFGANRLYREWDGSLADATKLKPVNRYIRDRYNFIKSRLMREHAVYTALFPRYAVRPSPPVMSNSAEVAYQSAMKAAVAGERQLSHFYSELQVDAVSARAKQMALTFGEGYVWADFDSSKGKQIPNTNKRIGNVVLRNLDPTQVVWGQGQRFEESVWHAVKCFYTAAEVKARYPEIESEKIKEDATSHAALSESVMDSGHDKGNLITVWHYFERPNPEAPRGRYCHYLCGEEVDKGAYPYNFDETNDEPWLIRYFYVQPEGKSRADGFVVDLIDPNRAANRRKNTESEWHGMASQPMVNIPRYIKDKQSTDIYPGKQWEKSPSGEGIEFVQPPQLPDWVQNSVQKILGDMDSIAGSYDFTNIAGSAAASSIQQIVQQDQQRRGEVGRQFRRSDAALGRRLLLLSRRHYTEPRKITYKSQTGETTINDFVAAHELPSYIDVEVEVGDPKTAAQNAAMVTQWGQMGAITPTEMVLAVQDNNPEMITEPLKLNIALQQRRNQEIFQLNDKTLEPMIREYAAMTAEFVAQGGDASQLSPPPGPWPHATKFENYDICLRVLENWFLTPEFAMMGEPRKQVAYWLHDELEMMRDQKGQKEMAMQAATAQQQGADNAARPAGAKVLPSQPSLQSNMPQDESAQAA